MKLNSIIFASLLAGMTSCSDFEEININPNNPSTVPANLLLPTIISTTASSITGSGAGAAGQFVQHLNYTGGNNEGFGRFVITGASFREEWNGPMRNVKDINQVLEIAESSEQPEYQAVGLICKVQVLQLMTDAYGDIPYDEAGRADEGYEFPHFEHQQDVYQKMLDDLDTANELLKNLSSGTSIDNDILYDGDLQKWRKLANTLRVRILMRMSAQLDVTERIAAVFNNPDEYPVFESIDDEATLVYNNSTDFYRWYIQEQNLPADGSGVDFGSELRISEAIVDSLQMHNDPRLTIYTAPTRNSYNANKQDPTQPLVYRGQPAGLSAVEQAELNKDDYSVLSRTIRSESRAFLVTYSELMLLKAEAIVRGIINGDASDTYTQGVRASIEKWGFVDADDTDAFLSRTDMQLADDTTRALSQIGTQMWIDSFLNGFEGYANWRRTGYPQLYVGPSVLSDIPVRYIYSDNEQNNPNLISWTNEQYGRMVNETDLVWFQPQKWPCHRN
ncbi:SusD/RagB family nutrient-binding outer membrane lipoprotein [Phocaeicola salanitronis]|uniref:SusD/RagB family nutrient-binding outer membrane lipoprotein n=1 Tax=Phocaeicola salanitronis TaxID=376805 RepID=UPI0023F8B028|nr:SusD/RagB family nutrient-binding outer membrane lipoprotein [Phocaeicola salanitronis]